MMKTGSRTRPGRRSYYKLQTMAAAKDISQGGAAESFIRTGWYFYVKKKKNKDFPQQCSLYVVYQMDVGGRPKRFKKHSVWCTR